MFKKIGYCTLGLLFAFNAQAFDKNKVNLDKVFWGTWSIYNEKAKCSESYQFSKPDQFSYSSLQKSMTGEFAVLRSNKSTDLDVLMMKVKSDNKAVSCGSAAVDYTKADIRLSLNWLSTKKAELCIDNEAKQCTGLYLIKQN